MGLGWFKKKPKKSNDRPRRRSKMDKVTATAEARDLMHKAMLHRNADEWEECLECFEKVLQIDSTAVMDLSKNDINDPRGYVIFPKDLPQYYMTVYKLAQNLKLELKKKNPDPNSCFVLPDEVMDELNKEDGDVESEVSSSSYEVEQRERFEAESKKEFEKKYPPMPTWDELTPEQQENVIRNSTEQDRKDLDVELEVEETKAAAEARAIAGAKYESQLVNASDEMRAFFDPQTYFRNPLQAGTDSAMQKEKHRYLQHYKDFDNAIKQDPKDPKAWVEKGNALLDAGRYAESIDCYDNAIELAPQELSLWYNKSIACYYLGKIEEAFRCNDKALELAPENMDVLTQYGILFEATNPKKSIKCYEEVLKQDPKNVNARFRKGVILSKTTSMRGLAFSTKDRLDAIKHFKEVLKQDPKHVNAWTMIGKVFYELDKKRHAGDIFLCCEAILEHDPDNMEAWDLIRKMGYKKYTQSIFKCCEIAHKKDPTNSRAWMMKAIVLNSSNQYEEAFQCLNTLQEIAPDESPHIVWNLKGEVAEKLKNHEECLKCYEKAIELDPKDGTGTYIGHAQRMVKKERKYLSEH